MSAASRKLFLLHFVADALLLWLGYLWLGVAESSRALLVLSALSAVGILAVACWHGRRRPADSRRSGWHPG